MPRVCTVCTHPENKAINAALVAGTPAPRLAALYRVSDDALLRHKEAHLPSIMTKAKSARDVTHADGLLAQVRTLQGKATGLLLKAEGEGDYRTALAGVREARGCVELLAKLLGELNDGPTINIVVSPQWVEIRNVVVKTLAPYPEAAHAVAAALAEVESNHAGN
jgi:hypothetical protein